MTTKYTKYGVHLIEINVTNEGLLAGEESDGQPIVVASTDMGSIVGYYNDEKTALTAAKQYLDKYGMNE